MLTLYGVARSRATRPLWTLLECGAEFDHRLVIQAYRAQSMPSVTKTSDPEFLKINPIGQIPVLVDGDLILTESLAIAQYIAQTQGGPISPHNAAEVALTNQWALFAATSVEPSAIEILYTMQDTTLFASSEGQAIVQVAAEKLRRPLGRLQAHLQDRNWLVSDRFTVADICVAECLRYAQGHPTLLAEFPAAKTWLERCQARPAFQEMMAMRMAEPA